MKVVVDDDQIFQIQKGIHFVTLYLYSTPASRKEAAVTFYTRGN